MLAVTHDALHDIREVAERLSIEGQLSGGSISEENRLRSKMGDCARTLFRALKKCEGETEDLKQSVIAFCAPGATEWARAHDLPKGHLHPTHYDLLMRCGARMVDFSRAAIAIEAAKAGETTEIGSTEGESAGASAHRPNTISVSEQPQ